MDKKQITTEELLELEKEIVDKEERQEILKQYGTESEWLSWKKHRLITGKALKLAKIVINNGGTNEEVKKAVLNLMVCMDAMKHKLNWKKWQQDNGILLLKQKYQEMTA